jgi:hypothetical protein
MGDDLDSYIINAESSGNPNAQNSRSSAGGLGQFIDSTWLGLIRQSHPEMANLPDNQILAMKTNPTLSRQMVDLYAHQNADYLHSHGFEPTPANIYLAHFAGPGGAVKVLGANPETPIVQVLGQGAVDANPAIHGMTASQVVNWAAGRVNGSAPAQANGLPATTALGMSVSPTDTTAAVAPAQNTGITGADSTALAGALMKNIEPEKITPNPPDVLNNSPLAGRLYAAMKPNIVQNMGGGLQLNQQIAQRLKGIIAGQNPYDPNAEQQPS